MKTLMHFIFFSFSFLFFSNAEAKNGNDAAEFLIAAADARRMNIEEGKLASERGTTQEIRDYGQQMIVEQTMLLGALLWRSKLYYRNLSVVKGRKN